MRGHTVTVYYHEEHRVPHIQVREQHAFSLSISEGKVLTPGAIPAPLLRAVRLWLQAHRSAVMAAWDLARSYQPIPPLGELEMPDGS